MSTGISSAYNSQITQNTTNGRLSLTNTVIPYGHFASTSGTSFGSSQNAGVQLLSNPLTSLKRASNDKRLPEEVDAMQQTTQKFSARLAHDHASVSHPDVDTPFMDELDVLSRLLPYHIFQQPKEDIEKLISGKGKERATSQACQDEIRDTRFALECHKRREGILDRWRKLKIHSGKREAPDDQRYFIAQVVLDGDRAENAWLGNELRTARTEAERIEREKRATANATRMSHFSSTPQPIMPTIHAQYYRGYPYAYTQAYGSTAATPTVSTFPASPAAPTNYAPYQSSGAIPVQLPVASLPALHALGIIPVPAASLPPEGQPQPPAVLRGSTANGTILSLEINVSLLQSAQMSGLAMVLNSLVARSNSAGNATHNAGGSSQHTVPVKHTGSNEP